MEVNKNIILGSGIAGLIAAYYLQEYNIIIGDRVGGAFNAHFKLGPQYLHKTKETEKLLDDLKLYPDEKEIKVGFYYNNSVHDNCPKSLRKKYFEKTFESKDEIPPHVLGGGKDFIAFDIDIKDVVNVLAQKLKDKIVVDTIHKIHVKENKLLSWQKEYDFSKCISTIPAPVFFRLANINGTEFKYKTCIFVLAKTTKKDIVENYDFVYFIDDDFRFSRITNLGNNNRVYEFLAMIPVRHEFMELIPVDVLEEYLLPNTEYISMYFQKYGKIIKDLNLEGFGKVNFLGRWAQWSGNILTHHVIKRVKSLADSDE